MKKFIYILVISASLSIVMMTKVLAADKPTLSYKTASNELRAIAPSKARSVLMKPKLTSGGSGGAEVTCCTHWNSSTGGTGCATFPDSCPDNQFQVDCGTSGCW